MHKDIIEEKKGVEMREQYKLHHIEIADKKKVQKEHIDTIIKKIQEDPKINGVVLYFHGGLSSEGYMAKELGPALMQSFFTENNLTNATGKLYPIFMNYKAGLLENEIFPLSLLLAHIIKKNLSKIKKKFYQVIQGTEIKVSPSDNARSLMNDALNSYAKTKTLIATDETLLEIMKKESLQEEIGLSLIQNNKELQAIAEIATEKETEEKGLVTNLKIAATIARAVARIAIGNNHQYFPTLLEELFRYFHIKYIAAKHWENIEVNSKDAFKKNHAGRYLINRLLDLKLKINTLSHSAGSIPTSCLTQYMYNNKKKLNNVVMIAPAINQKDFFKYIIKSTKTIKNLKFHILREEAEKDDDVLKIYSASLLYFVSGVAENVWYSDKMLLIEQHLHREKKPYSLKKYHSYVLGKRESSAVKKVWNYLEKNPSVLNYYPFKVSDPIKSPHSHECTKYPWVAKDLALKVLSQLHKGDMSGNTQFKIEKPNSNSMKNKCK